MPLNAQGPRCRFHRVIMAVERSTNERAVLDELFAHGTVRLLEQLATTSSIPRSTARTSQFFAPTTNDYICSCKRTIRWCETSSKTGRSFVELVCGLRNQMVSYPPASVASRTCANSCSEACDEGQPRAIEAAGFPPAVTWPPPPYETPTSDQGPPTVGDHVEARKSRSAADRRNGTWVGCWDRTPAP